MTLREITIDNSVRYVPIIEKTKEKEIKPKTKKAGSLPRKQSRNRSRNNKKFLTNVAASGFCACKCLQNRFYTNICVIIDIIID